MLNKGDKYNNYLTLQSKEILEHNCRFIELVHEPSNATVYHIENDDDNNLFCISFQTLPNNSTGVAHILEHCVFCGSKNFPYKDPFFSMLRRSLKTFMNAMTGSDCTFYPASSQIKEDFYNLLTIYIDAVFFPCLRKVSFLQEGHRIEFTEDEKELQFKGVVYNEMKGALTSADDRFMQANMHRLMADTPYNFDSGGDPKEIPNLTYEEFISFHKNYYHPSRAIFFFFGNIPTKEHLDFLDEKVFNKVHDALPKLDPVKKQPRFSEPKKALEFYPANRTDGSMYILGISWLTVDIADQLDILTLCLVDSLLLETDASYLKKAILDSKLATSIESCLDEQINEIPWILLCKGCKKEDLSKLERLILDTLQETVERGFDSALVQSALYQLEFSKAEIASKAHSRHSSYALKLFDSILIKHHGVDPSVSLQSSELFSKLKARLQNSDYLSQFIYEKIVTNRHRLTLELHPDTDLIQREKAHEEALLAKIYETLGEQEKAMILQQTKTLNEYQHKRESTDKLPLLEKNAIPATVKDFALQKNDSIYSHSVFTNDVQYVDLLFPLPHIESCDIPYLGLFAQYLTEMGTAKLSYEANLQRINSCCGHLGASISLNVDAQDSSLCYPMLAIRVVGLRRRQEQMLKTVMDIIENVNFNDPKRLESLIEQSFTHLNNAIIENAFDYAQSLALSAVCKTSCLYDMWDGFQHYQFMNGLHGDLGKSMDKLIERLEALQKAILAQPFDTVLCSDKASIAELTAIIKTKTARSTPSWSPTIDLGLSSHARLIPSPVAFTALGFTTVQYSHPLSPAILVATRLLHDKVLHKQIREIGGAYGSGARYNPILGTFHFFGYRDPNLKRTVDTCAGSLENFHKVEYRAEDLWQAKLGILQSLDFPVAPGNRALSAYNWQKTGNTKELRQKYRQAVIAVTDDQLNEAVSKHLKPQLTKSALVSFADKSFFDKDNLETPLPLKELFG